MASAPASKRVPLETILDPAEGTGGFLVESYEHLKPHVKSVEERRRLQEETLFGIEKKPMHYSCKSKCVAFRNLLDR